MSFPVIAISQFCAVAANDTRAIRQPSRDVVGDEYRKLASIPDGWVTLTGHPRWHGPVISMLRTVPRPAWDAELALMADDVGAWAASLAPDVRETAVESCKGFAILGGNPFSGWELNWYAGTCERGGVVTGSVPTGADEALVVENFQRLYAASATVGVLTMVRLVAGMFARVRETLGDDGSLSDRIELGILEKLPDLSWRSRWIPPMPARELAKVTDLRTVRPPPPFSIARTV